MKIVTPDGELLHTGMGSLKDSDAQNVYRYGIGPTIDGLFTQSGMGIIVEITIELMPVPECVEMFVFSSRDENDAGRLTEVIRNLKLNGVVNSAVHIANRSRAIGEKTNRFAGAWNLSGAITGTPGMVRAKRKAVKKEFRRHIKTYKLHFLGKRSMSLVKWIHEHIKPVPVYDALRDAFDLITGVPTDHPLKTLLNDDDLTSEHIDTRHYKTCFSWINAVCQCREESINKLLHLINSEFTEHGYEFRVTFTAVNPRTLIMISNISYPRSEPEIQKAEEFLTRCQKKLTDNGFYPYRSGSGIHEKTPQHESSYHEFLKRIKETIDPNGIIAPGKYNL
jgi:4-cresol dehydrogenase (hydroxylating)